MHRVASCLTGRTTVLESPEEDAKLERFHAECAEIEARRVPRAQKLVRQILADPQAVAELKAALGVR